MSKIGRNDPCPCGSGKKFKKCCYLKQKEGGLQQQSAAPQVSLQGEVAAIQEAAVKKEAKILHLGVFVLFSTAEGDAWLLELTDMDGVQVARNGERLDMELVENQETIEVNWSHSFSIKNKKFVATSYQDQSVTTFDDYPTHSIQAAIKKIKKKFSPDLLKSIHITEEKQAAQS